MKDLLKKLNDRQIEARVLIANNPLHLMNTLIYKELIEIEMGLELLIKRVQGWGFE